MPTRKAAGFSPPAAKFNFLSLGTGTAALLADSAIPFFLPKSHQELLVLRAAGDCIATLALEWDATPAGSKDATGTETGHAVILAIRVRLSYSFIRFLAFAQVSVFACWPGH